eukprot:TRINITY_DN18552_c0_g1_i5.p1 TRINITY_DN18552_c0_g1~~TRINITY_DN18552_c0_g1_i5.p1  ORF type:complete len:118 (+),score=25.69 TRINITY_DN18552_c0_g1_i5:158-511(+)
MQRGLVGSEMCIRDRRRVHGYRANVDLCFLNPNDDSIVHISSHFNHKEVLLFLAEWKKELFSLKNAQGISGIDSITDPELREIILSKINQFSFIYSCLLYTSPSPRDLSTSRMPSSA